MAQTRMLGRVRLVVATATIISLAWILFGALLYTRQVRPPEAPAVASRASTAVPSPPSPVRRLVIPVRGVTADQLVDTWGNSRGGGSRVHEAIDVMAPRGTPVLAAAPGTVEKLFLSERGGITIYIRSPDRRTIDYYAHLDSYAPGLSEGEAVRAGEVIGYVGSSGDASPDAPHLHFAIEQVGADQGWWEGTAINPYPLLKGP